MLHKKSALLLASTIQAISCSAANVKGFATVQLCDENLYSLAAQQAEDPHQKKQADHQSITADGVCHIKSLSEVSFGWLQSLHWSQFFALKAHSSTPKEKAVGSY